MKDFIRKKITTNNLYKKEQRIIFTILLCFLISGLCLPTFKEQLLAKGILKENAIVCSQPKTNQKNDKKLEKETEKKETEDDNKENVEPENDYAEIPETTETFDDANNNTATDNTPSTTKENNSPNSSTKKPSSNSSNSSSSGSNGGASSGSGSNGSSATPEKVWVPPVYKTVHHEAVYDTVRVVICNYCGATFSSTGEFQVHKDANGG